jgi:hypothetical protein
MNYPRGIGFGALNTGTCFIQKIYAPSSSLLQGKHLPFTPSPLRLNIFRLFVILSLTQLYRYTPEIFLFSTATFKYTYRDPLMYYENENGQKYVLEFNGKFWHGCLHCYNASTVNPVNGMTMCDLYQRTIEKKRYLEGQGYVYVGKWECKFDREVRENDTLRNSVNASVRPP